jgi:putative ABC transport system permease protein
MPLAWRFAARELRAGVRGFRIFLACLALGVAAIAAAGSTAEAFRMGLASQAGEILGGDVAITLHQRQVTPAEHAALERIGRVSYAVSASAMAQAPDGARRLVELRGVAGPYPLVGAVQLSPGATLAEALTPQGDAAGAAVEQPLLDSLHLKLGERFLVGNVPMVARAVLISEPDRLARGFALGPRVLTRADVVQRGGFLTPGLPFGETARIALPPGTPLIGAERRLRQIMRASGPGSFRLQDRSDATPGLSRLIDELEYFLAFIGLASLVAGGLGVFGAVSAFLDGKTESIAVLKALGARGDLPRDVYLIQIGLLAALGVAIGLFIGAVTPLLLGEAIKGISPVPALFAIYPAPLLRAAAFGLLAAAAFGLAPLGRARATPPSALFRGDASRAPGFGIEIVFALLAGVGLAALAVSTAPTPVAALVMIAGVAIAFGLLWLMGSGLARGAGRWRGRLRGAVRIGVANLAGPRSAARTAAPAIGLGVALLAAIVLIQSSLLAQVSKIAPSTAPAMVFAGIPADRAAEFDASLAKAFGRPLTPLTYLRAPFATGRIVAVRGAAVETSKIAQPDRWAYDNDISISAIGPRPRGAEIVEGHWWPANYAGPPLVALAADAAKGEHLKVGDTISLALLGRTIDARVAVIRNIDFAGFGANFPIVLDPAAIEGAGLDEVAEARATPAEEARATRALGADFPRVNVISVREALQTAVALFGKLSLAIRAAAGVAAVAGLLVLIGAIATGARSRAREAATLKVLGASSGQILLAYGVEYGAVGLIAGVAGVALGYAAAWPVVVEVFKATWSVDWAGVASLILGAAALAGLGGLAAALGALAKRPAETLRSE